MKQVRHIALALIVLMIASPAWALMCATHCTQDPASTMHAVADSYCDGPAQHQDQGNKGPCAMAATCHFAASPVIGMRAQTAYVSPQAFAPQTPIQLPLSADPLPPFKPPQ